MDIVISMSNSKKKYYRKVDARFTEVEDDILLECHAQNKDLEYIADELAKLYKRTNAKRKFRQKTYIKQRLFELLQDSVENKKVEYKKTTLSLRDSLHARDYWDNLKQQLTTSELQYFESMWIRLMDQFREDVLPSEELQLKQFILIDILIDRCLIERKKHIEETERLQKLVEEEYNKDAGLRDDAILAVLEQNLSYARNSVSSHTTEHMKLIDKSQSLSKDLKANRDARIKRVEDSKTHWAGLIRLLEKEDEKIRLGDEMEVMRIAKDKSRDKLAEWHIYQDGKADQPFLNADTIKDDDTNDGNDEPNNESNITILDSI